MIPLQLKLRNFLSYGSHTQTVNFEPYHLVCLSGKNGHGKSALLDAITWVLWGQARKTGGTSKADDGLIRLGQTHMMVSLDFIHNNQRYRVSREFVKTNKKSHTELNFGIAKNDDPTTFTSLSEKTIRGTQQKIINTLGIDYDSCINSIFLRQGQSNEFSKKSAKERKDILANILGLDRYEILRKEAMEKARTYAQEQKACIQHLDRIAEELKNKPAIGQSLQETSKTIETISEQEKAFRIKLKQQETEKQELLTKQNELKIIEFKIKQLTLSQEDKIKKLQTTFGEWRSVRKNARLKLKKHYSEEEKKALYEQEELYEKKRIVLTRLKEELFQFKEKQSQLKQSLLKNYSQELNQRTIAYQNEKLSHDSLHNKCIELDKKITIIKTEKQKYHADFQQREKIIQSFNDLEKKLKQEEKHLDRRKTYYHHFVARGNQLTQELTGLHQKKHLGSTTNEPVCPLCEQALSGSRKKFLYDKFSHEENFRSHQITRLKRIIPELKIILVNQHKNLEELKKQQAELVRLQDQQNYTNNQIKILEKELNDLEQSKTQLNLAYTQQKSALIHSEIQLKKHKETESTYCDKNDKFQKLELTIQAHSKKISAIIYNTEKHNELKQEIKKISEQQTLLSEQSHQLSLQQHRKERVQKLCKEIRVIKKELFQEQKLFNTYEQNKNLLKEIQNNLTSNHNALQMILKEKEILLQKKGALEQSIAALKKQEEEYKKYEKLRKEHQTNYDDYQEIALALSKNGIQALLIENAIPEIEEEANFLLSKLTDNRSHIIIESVRDLKSGGTRETLDIKISDALGIRPYELFSGGEAFRIDFSLRIAISKLLARRSGTSLQTLVIDEGFGSQDEEGLNNIMEALYKIQDDFAKIIIVSHLATMKNQFPTHFFIQKNPQGSTVAVIEQI